jgi:hypothetical protein
VTTAPMTMPRSVRYYRHLESGDFSLQANTEAVPEPGHFYVLQQGRVLLRSDDFDVAEAAYQDLCRAHWGRQLESESLSCRMAGAWGLLGLEPTHRDATAVIEQDGGTKDQARLVHLRNRRIQMERRARLMNRKRTPAASPVAA